MSRPGSVAEVDEPAATDGAQARPVTFGGGLKSEWIKFRSLRSTWWVFATPVVRMVPLARVTPYNPRHLSSNQQPEDLVPSAPLQGSDLAQLLVGALGI